MIVEKGRNGQDNKFDLFREGIYVGYIRALKMRDGSYWAECYPVKGQRHSFGVWGKGPEGTFNDTNAIEVWNRWENWLNRIENESLTPGVV